MRERGLRDLDSAGRQILGSGFLFPTKTRTAGQVREKETYLDGKISSELSNVVVESSLLPSV